MHAVSEVSAKEREAAARAELEAKDLVVVAGSVPLTRGTSKECLSMHTCRATLQGRILQLEARVKSAVEEVEYKTNSILHSWKALVSD